MTDDPKPNTKPVSVRQTTRLQAGACLACHDRSSDEVVEVRVGLTLVSLCHACAISLAGQLTHVSSSLGQGLPTNPKCSSHQERQAVGVIEYTAVRPDGELSRWAEWMCLECEAQIPDRDRQARHVSPSRVLPWVHGERKLGRQP